MRSSKIRNCQSRYRVQLNRGGPKLWSFLEHNGPAFPLNYEAMDYPNCQFVYNKFTTKLSRESMKGAFYYARISQSIPQNINRKAFDRNFFNDWKKQMTPRDRKIIRKFSLCDFRCISNQISEVLDKDTDTEIEDHAEASENESTDDDELPHAVLDARDIYPKTRKLDSNNFKVPLEEYMWNKNLKHGWCRVDHRKERLLNYTVNGPGVFIDPSGKCNKLNGKIRNRVQPEDVIINCSEDSRIPKPPKGRKWKKVIHNCRVSWIAAWKDNVTKEWKYIKVDLGKLMERSYEIRSKFDSARDIQYFIEKFRIKYNADMNSDSKMLKELALSVYMIDKWSFTIQEPVSASEDYDLEIDTIPCCSLKCRNIKLVSPSNVIITQQNKTFEYVVSSDIFNCLEYLVNLKEPGDFLFDEFNTEELREYLKWKDFQITPMLLRIYNTSSAFNESFMPEDFPNHDLGVIWHRALEITSIEGNFYSQLFLHEIKSSKNTLQELLTLITELEDKFEREECEQKSRKLELQLTRAMSQEANLRKSIRKLLATKKSIETRIISNFLDPRIYLFHLRKIKTKKISFQIVGFWNQDQFLNLTWALKTTKSSDDTIIEKFNWFPIKPIQYFYDFDSTKYYYEFH